MVVAGECDARCMQSAIVYRSSMSGQPVKISDFLRGDGFDSEQAQHEARIALERAGLTRPGKQAFVADKLPRARKVLAARLLRACAGCRAGADAGSRLVVEVSQPNCELCGGSNNRRAARRCARALARRGIERVLVVGGTPAQHLELRQLFGESGVSWRMVDGTRASHSAKEAELNKRWAQVIVVWGPTPLRHSVSELYTEQRYAGLKVVQVPRRGIEALCDELVRGVGA
jgi:hypothetical protein